jgi:hypothetical protein
MVQERKDVTGVTEVAVQGVGIVLMELKNVMNVKEKEKWSVMSVMEIQE